MWPTAPNPSPFLPGATKATAFPIFRIPLSEKSHRSPPCWRWHPPTAPAPPCFREWPAKNISLNGVLIARRNRLRAYPRARHIASIVHKNSRRLIDRRVEWNLDLDAPLGPQKLHPLIRHDLRPARENRLPAAEFQNRRRQPVGPEIRVALHHSAHPQRLRSKHKPRRSNRIAPDVQQPAAAPLRFMPHVLGVPVEVAEHPHNRAQFPNPPFANQLPGPQPLRVRLHHKRFANFHAGALPHRQQRPRFRGVQRDGLFAQHVLPRLRRLDGPRHVQVIRQRIVDRLNFRIAQQFLIRSISLFNFQPGSRRPGLVQIARSDSRHLTPRALLHPRNHFAHRDGRRAQNAPLHLLPSLLFSHRSPGLSQFAVRA